MVLITPDYLEACWIHAEADDNHDFVQLRQRPTLDPKGQARDEANVMRVQQPRRERHALGRRRPRGVDFLQRRQSRVKSKSMRV